MKKTILLSLIVITVLTTQAIFAEDFIFKDIEQKLDKNKINDVELSEVLKAPSLYKNTIIRFNAKFIQSGKLSRVFHTKYNLSEYQNFSVWPDEVKLWKKEGLKSYLPLLFVKKGNKTATQVAKMKKYERIRIIGQVTNDYQNQPWVEVIEIDAFGDDPLTEETLYHIRLADKYHYGDTPGLMKDGKAINMGVNLSRAEIEYKKALEFELSNVEKCAVWELLGEVQLNQNKLDEAIASLKETINISPKRGYANFLLSRAYHQKGELETALSFGKIAYDSMTKDKEVLLMNAKILIDLKNYDLAKHYCITALRLDDEDIRTYAFLGTIYDAKGEYDVSKEMYRRAINLKDGVDNFDLHKNMAHQLLKIALVDKDPKEKENALTQANREFDASINQINDKDPEAFYLWGRVLEESSKRPNYLNDAISKFDKATALKPDYYKAFIRKADILNHKLHKPDESVASYEKASAILPLELYPLKSLEGIYRKQKNYAKTIDVNKRILVIDPKNVQATYLIGMDYHKELNDQAKASEWFTTVLNLDPTYLNVSYYLGVSIYLNKKPAESIKHLEVASKTMADDKMVWFYLSKAYFETNNSKTIDALNSYHKLDNENIETRILLAKEYLKRKDATSAVTVASEAAEMSKKQKTLVPEAHCTYGWALAQSGNAQKALPILERSNGALNTNESRYHLAYVYVDQSMFVEAEGVLEKINGLDEKSALFKSVQSLKSSLEKKKKEQMDLKKREAQKEAKESKEPKEKTTKGVDKSEDDKKEAREKEKLARKEAEAKEKADKEAKELAEKKAKEDAKLAKEKAKEEEKAQEKAKEKAEKEAKEAEKVAKREADKKAKEDAEANEKAMKEKEKAEKKAQEEAEIAKEAAEKKAKEDAKEKEKADKEAKELAEKKAKEDAQAKKDAEEKMKKDASAKQENSREAKAAAKRQKDEEEKKLKEAENLRKKQEADAKKAAKLREKQEEERKKEEAAEAKKMAKIKAKDEADRKKIEEAQKKKEENQAAALLKKENEEKKKAEKEAKLKAKEEEKRKKEEEKQKEKERKEALELADKQRKLAEKAEKERLKLLKEAEELKKKTKK